MSIKRYMTDITDVKILNILLENSRTPVKIISEKVNLSAPATKERINKMIAGGLIREFTTILEPNILGRTVTAFMWLTLRKPDTADRFNELIAGEKDILACYYLTGEYDYLLQIVTDSSASLEHMITRLRNSHEFARTSTSVVLSTIKERTSVSP